MYYMTPDENHSFIPSMISADMKINGLDRYCRLEGMDYQQLASEANSRTGFWGKKRFSAAGPARNQNN